MRICSLLISGSHIPKGPTDSIRNADKEGRVRSSLQYHLALVPSPSEPRGAASKTHR